MKRNAHNFLTVHGIKGFGVRLEKKITMDGCSSRNGWEWELGFYFYSINPTFFSLFFFFLSLQKDQNPNLM
ncbi:hypothetical protein HanIR_Chr01g0011881 [Helianthus annuus]|nr:hypothetical protein HanIR_Chr01g0011881 [Helianthus annuus]